jgi:hypothetical protein
MAPYKNTLSEMTPEEQAKIVNKTKNESVKYAQSEADKAGVPISFGPISAPGNKNMQPTIKGGQVDIKVIYDSNKKIVGTVEEQAPLIKSWSTGYWEYVDLGKSNIQIGGDMATKIAAHGGPDNIYNQTFTLTDKEGKNPVIKTYDAGTFDAATNMFTPKTYDPKIGKFITGEPIKLSSSPSIPTFVSSGATDKDVKKTFERAPYIGGGGGAGTISTSGPIVDIKIDTKGNIIEGTSGIIGGTTFSNIPSNITYTSNIDTTTKTYDISLPKEYLDKEGKLKQISYPGGAYVTPRPKPIDIFSPVVQTVKTVIGTTSALASAGEKYGPPIIKQLPLIGIPGTPTVGQLITGAEIAGKVVEKYGPPAVDWLGRKAYEAQYIPTPLGNVSPKQIVTATGIGIKAVETYGPSVVETTGKIAYQAPIIPTPFGMISSQDIITGVKAVETYGPSVVEATGKIAYQAPIIPTPFGFTSAQQVINVGGMGLGAAEQYGPIIAGAMGKVAYENIPIVRNALG